MLRRNFFKYVTGVIGSILLPLKSEGIKKKLYYTIRRRKGVRGYGEIVYKKQLIAKEVKAYKTKVGELKFIIPRGMFFSLRTHTMSIENVL